jgi:hypothetical protein
MTESTDSHGRRAGMTLAGAPLHKPFVRGTVDCCAPGTDSSLRPADSASSQVRPFAGPALLGSGRLILQSKQSSAGWSVSQSVSPDNHSLRGRRRGHVGSQSNLASTWPPHSHRRRWRLARPSHVSARPAMLRWRWASAASGRHGTQQLFLTLRRHPWRDGRCARPAWAGCTPFGRSATWACSQPGAEEARRPGHDALA